MADFSGRVVLLTGATGGFGRAAARYFADAGASLVLSDLKAEPLERLAAELSGTVRTLAGDVSDPALSERLVEAALADFGRLDVAVNNAGVVHDMAPLPKTPVDVARKVIDVDLMGVFYAMRAQLPVLEQRFRDTGEVGAIVNVASVAGVVGAPMLSVYSAAKHGVVGLTKSAAIEYARRGVRVNALCPSFARTAMAEDFLDKAGKDHDAAEAALVQAIPMRRLAEVDEVIAGLVFLADPASSFVTGQTLQIDGGLSAA
ncbi:SDR family NAD(P)-dependent oxidoreductase [Hoeflea sp.]|uniref:SDR family NAD(P)-dependent oxidoreductase n=1 Tax=Hoeflea sp. TaxID=1940281 RepID=UPI0019870554|nr:SDR family NAD(P)-dependent oxidoreductase [Hoeflea sp.]MBC7280436.1 SDR family oxidoreductase [Hoeflea sp.]